MLNENPKVVLLFVFAALTGALVITLIFLPHGSTGG